MNCSSGAASNSRQVIQGCKLQPQRKVQAHLTVGLCVLTAQRPLGTTLQEVVWSTYACLTLLRHPTASPASCCNSQCGCCGFNSAAHEAFCTNYRCSMSVLIATGTCPLHPLLKAWCVTVLKSSDAAAVDTVAAALWLNAAHLVERYNPAVRQLKRSVRVQVKHQVSSKEAMPPLSAQGAACCACLLSHG